MKYQPTKGVMIALVCVIGFTVVLVIDRMGRKPAPDVASVPVPSGSAIPTNAPWHWSVKTVRVWKVEQPRARRVHLVNQPSVRPSGQLDLIDFRHQPTVTVDLAQ